MTSAMAKNSARPSTRQPRRVRGGGGARHGGARLADADTGSPPRRTRTPFGDAVMTAVRWKAERERREGFGGVEHQLCAASGSVCLVGPSAARGTHTPPPLPPRPPTTSRPPWRPGGWALAARPS